MVKKETYIIGVLFIIILLSLAFDNYKTIEGLSNINKVDYTLIKNCNNTIDNTNIPSYGFYFSKDSFNPFYFFSDTTYDVLKRDFLNNVINTKEVFNYDKCNNVLYSISGNNKISGYKLDDIMINFEMKINNENIAYCFIQFMKDSKIEYDIKSKDKTINFNLNDSIYKITLTQMDLNFTVSGMNSYDVLTIESNGNIFYNKNSENVKKYIYGKITYDSNPTHFINCICINYYK